MSDTKVLSQGRYQINDTHLHFPVKSTIAQQAHMWYTKKILKYEKMTTHKENPLSPAIFSDCVKSLLRMPTLKAKVPEWMRVGVELVTKVSTDPADQGMNLIQKGWKQLYLDPLNVEGFEKEAQEHHQKEVERRRDREIAEAVLSVDAGQRVQAVRAILARTSETVDENLPDEVRDVVRVEGSWHESCVPVVPPTKRYVQSRPGTSHRSKRDQEKLLATLRSLEAVKKKLLSI